MLLKLRRWNLKRSSFNYLRIVTRVSDQINIKRYSSSCDTFNPLRFLYIIVNYRHISTVYFIKLMYNSLMYKIKNNNNNLTRCLLS